MLVIEDLHVAGMLRNRKLTQHIAGANWAEIRRQLTYKTERAGARLVVADRWFASSKTCSGCGVVRAKLALSERTFVCMSCAVVLNRDHNAARNLAALAADTGELRREQPDGSDVRPVVLACPAVAPPREGREKRSTSSPRGGGSMNGAERHASLNGCHDPARRDRRRN